MGEGTGCNFVIADVYENKTINFRLISINSEDINALGDLEDYILP